jgi:hypothetical protein
MIHDVTKEMIRAHLTLVHVFHAHALSRCTPIRYGRIASILVTHNAT